MTDQPAIGALLRHASGALGRVLERRGKKRPKVLVETATGLRVEWFLDKCAIVAEAAHG